MSALICKTTRTNTWDPSSPTNSIPTVDTVDSQGQNDTQFGVHFLNPSTPIAFLGAGVKAPFEAIEELFDYLQSAPKDAAALSATYPHRDINKTAAMFNSTSGQKFTIDLSPNRIESIPSELSASLSKHGLQEILSFFNTVNQTWSTRILDSPRVFSGGVDLMPAHRAPQVNFRICDYNPQTASPENGTGGLGIEDPSSNDTWIPIPGDAIVVLAGWCAVILTGVGVVAARHRVRRTSGIRRLSCRAFRGAPAEYCIEPPCWIIRFFEAVSRPVKNGELTVGWFKELMDKKWRHREGNEDLDSTSDLMSQNDEIG